MNWAWATSLDQVWRSPAFPTWLTIAAAGFFGIVLLITLLRAERSVANGALAVVTLLAIGIAAIVGSRGFGPCRCSRTGRRAAIAAAGQRRAAGAVVYRRSRGRDGFDGLRKGPVRIGGVCRGRGILCGIAGDAADRARRRRRREPQHDPRIAGASAFGRTRPLWIGGACAADARPLHAVGLCGVPFADGSQPDRREHG